MIVDMQRAKYNLAQFFWDAVYKFSQRGTTDTVPVALTISDHRQLLPARKLICATAGVLYKVTGTYTGRLRKIRRQTSLNSFQSALRARSNGLNLLQSLSVGFNVEKNN